MNIKMRIGYNNKNYDNNSEIKACKVEGYV